MAAYTVAHMMPQFFCDVRASNWGIVGKHEEGRGGRGILAISVYPRVLSFKVILPRNSNNKTKIMIVKFIAQGL